MLSTLILMPCVNGCARFSNYAPESSASRCIKRSLRWTRRPIDLPSKGWRFAAVRLDAAAKGAAIDSLQSALPAEMLETLAPQLQTELREQTQTLQAKGATPSEIRLLRQQLVGNAATARLENLDRKRQDWQRRVKAYREEKVRIENSRGLGETDKRTAINRMAAERFDENERLRLEAAEQLLATKNG